MDAVFRDLPSVGEMEPFLRLESFERLFRELEEGNGVLF